MGRSSGLAALLNATVGALGLPFSTLTLARATTESASPSFATTSSSQVSPPTSGCSRSVRSTFLPSRRKVNL